MISVGNGVLLTGVIVTAGTFANGKGIEPRTIVGGAFLGVGLLTLSQIDNQLAQRIGFLVLLTAAFLYVPTIAFKLGLIKTKPTPWEWDSISGIRGT